MVNIREFIINASILLAIIYLTGLFHKHLFSHASNQVKAAILLFAAIIAGWCSMFFGIHLSNAVIFDLRFIPIIVVTFYASRVYSILLVGIGIGLMRLSFGISVAAFVGMLNMLILAAAGMVIFHFSKRWPEQMKMWVTVLTLNILNAVVIAAVGVMDLSLYLSTVMPVAVPMSIIFSWLLFWVVRDFWDDYLLKLDLEEKALRDSLTKLYNRRAFMRYYNSMMSDGPAVEPAAVAILDIDFFKKVNDEHGHITGDLILQKVSRLIEENLRSIDIVARYGGEEFVIILPSCDKIDAMKAVNRIRELVEATPFSVNSLKIHITISGGVAAMPEVASDKLLASADAALYKAKENGRNLIAYFEAEAAPAPELSV